MSNNSLSHFGQSPLKSDDYFRTVTEKKEIVWERLGQISVKQALEAWYRTLPESTKKNYRAGFNRLVCLGLLDLRANLQQFALANHEVRVDEIKRIEDWSEATRQARAAGYISFTSFLQRRTQGIVAKASANREGVGKTFYKVRDKVKTPALSKNQTQLFFDELKQVNYRDYLVAKVILQGGKRKGEVLGLRRKNIHFGKNRIFFDQSKTRGVQKQTVIGFPESFMKELAGYLGDRTGLIFVTRNLKRISPYQLNRTFSRAGKRASIPFRVTPHVLRVTLVTRLKELHVQDSDIMKITGHASPVQLSSYDKSDLADNATSRFHFV